VIRHAISTLTLAVAVALASTNALAAPSVAQERFEEGRAFMKEGNARDAIPKFLASLAAEPTAAAALNLADAYERIGQTASAYHRFRQVEDLARDKDPMRALEAKKRADALLPRLATITVKEPKTASVRVAIDGAPVERGGWNVPRPYDLGAHEVVAEADGRRIAKTIRIASESDRLVVDADDLLRADPNAAATGPAVAPGDTGTERSSGSPLRTIGIITMGVGAAGLVTGGVFGVLALGAKSDLEARCPQYPSCPRGSETEVHEADDRAHRLGDASTISFAIGGALVVTGAVLFLVAPSKEKRITANGRGLVFVF
jgi:hypothetical protein